MKETSLGLLIPEDADAPDGPTQIGGNAEKTNALLLRAGAQAKKFVHAAEQAVNPVGEAFAHMPTPVRVQGIVLPADGLIFVSLQAQWKESVGGPAVASIFLDDDRVKIAAGAATAPSAALASADYQAEMGPIWRPLASCSSGLVSPVGEAAYTGDVTTGQVLGVANAVTDDVGGPVCAIFAPADTYDVSIRIQDGNAETLMKACTLRVWTKAFA